MIRCLPIAAGLLIAQSSFAQITIDHHDVPLAHDTLRFSNASPIGGTSWAADSGAGRMWNYMLVPTSQGVDEYKHPGEVSPGLTSGLFASITADFAYGPKVADSIPGIGIIASGVTIKNLHTYYNIYAAPVSFVAEAFSATISGIPIGADYILPDMVYKFPLTYGNNDVSDFHLKFGAALFGSIEQKGTRTTRVDGWGTITTPYYTTPTPCIRVRSEITEIDSVSLSGNTFGIERTTIEYKWLVKGAHQPALMTSAQLIAGNEIGTTVRYQDKYRPELATAVGDVTTESAQITAFPNPVTNGQVQFTIPASWHQYYTELFDAQGRLVRTTANESKMDVSMLAAGNYLARITCGSTTAYVKITK